MSEIGRKKAEPIHVSTLASKLVGWFMIVEKLAKN
jgi:hypothetical protein